MTGDLQGRDVLCNRKEGAKGEILLDSPAQPQVGLTVTLAEPPDLAGPLADFGAKIMASMAIPGAKWPSNRRLQLEIQFAVVPLGIKAVIDNKDSE